MLHIFYETCGYFIVSLWKNQHDWLGVRYQVTYLFSTLEVGLQLFKWFRDTAFVDYCLLHICVNQHICIKSRTRVACVWPPLAVDVWNNCWWHATADERRECCSSRWGFFLGVVKVQVRISQSVVYTWLGWVFVVVVFLVCGLAVEKDVLRWLSAVCLFSVVKLLLVFCLL